MPSGSIDVLMCHSAFINIYNSFKELFETLNKKSLLRILRKSIIII